MFRYFRGPCLLILSSLFFSGQIKSQSNTVSGTVFDDRGEIVQFAYVFVNEDSTKSVFTDIDGKFKFSNAGNIQKLTFLHYDFQPYIYRIESTVPDTLKVVMTPKKDQEKQRKWTSHKNDPVFYVIDKAVALEHLNDPEKVGGTFKYTTYSETVVDLFKLKDHKIPDKYKNRVEEDSLFLKHHHIHGHQHLEVMETVTERVFKYPDKNHERVLGLKVTGLEDVEVAPLHSNRHPISFYNNYFDFLGTRYATPLGKRTHEHYDFHHQATWYQGEDTIHVIHFRPSHLRVMGLEGTMYLNSNNYAIQNIVVRPVEHKIINFQISQKFEFIQDKEWFPKQINYEYIIYKTPKKYLGTIYDKKTYIKDVELNPDLSKDKQMELCVCDHYATKQSEQFWNSHRIDPLTKKQRRTYLRVDTLRHQNTPAIIIERVMGFYKSKLTYKLPFMEVGNVFRANRFEGARLGLQGWAGKDHLQVIEFSGFGAYGIKDERWKWGAGVGFFLNKEHDAELKFEHRVDLEEPGDVKFIHKEPDFFRRIFTARMDGYESNRVLLSFRTPGYHLVELGFDDYSRQALYDYQFVVEQNGNGDVLENTFDFSAFTFRTRYAVNEKTTHILGEVARMDTHYPVFYLNYTKGFSNILNGDFDFHKIVANIDYKFHVGHIGLSEIALEGGYMNSNVPYPILFNGRGGNLSTSSIIIRDHFQTMDIYEFTSNQYFNIFYAHDFGSLIFAHSKFKPDFVIYQHVGWGDLNNKDLHRGTDAITRTYEDGFFESGLGINNFLKFRAFGKIYGGLGLGFFYRYGPEKNAGGFGENFVYRLTYTIKSL